MRLVLADRRRGLLLVPFLPGRLFTPFALLVLLLRTAAIMATPIPMLGTLTVPILSIAARNVGEATELMRP